MILKEFLGTGSAKGLKNKGFLGSVPHRVRSHAYYAALADEKGRCDMSDFPFGGEYRA